MQDSLPSLNPCAGYSLPPLKGSTNTSYPPSPQQKRKRKKEHVMLFLSKEAHQRLGVQGICWDWSCRHPAYLPHKNKIQIPRGKQGFNVNHIVYANTLGTESHPYQLTLQEYSKNQFLTCWLWAHLVNRCF